MTQKDLKKTNWKKNYPDRVDKNEQGFVCSDGHNACLENQVEKQKYNKTSVHWVITIHKYLFIYSFAFFLFISFIWTYHKTVVSILTVINMLYRMRCNLGFDILQHNPIACCNTILFKYPQYIYRAYMIHFCYDFWLAKNFVC